MFGVRGRRVASPKISEDGPTTARPTSVRTACLAVALALMTVVAAPPPTAEAAPYTVWACANASGAPLGVGSWVRMVDSSLAEAQATCAEPSAGVGAIRAAARATPGGGGGWLVAATRGTRITGLDVWWSWQLPATSAAGAIRVSAPGSIYLGAGSGVDPFDGQGRCCSDSAFVRRKPGVFGVPSLTNPAVALGNLNHQSFPKLRGPDGHGAPLVGLSALCVSGCASSDVVALYQAYRVKTTVEDPSPPAGRAEGLRDGLRVGSGSAVDATASDAGGGVREFTLRVDGNVVQRLRSGAGCADVDPANGDPSEYNVMKPCPSTLAGRLTLGPAQMPDNQPHLVTAVATDAAGQDTTLGSARAALAAPRGFYDPKNGFYNPDLSLGGARKANGRGSRRGSRLTLGFVRRHRTTSRSTVGYATRPRIRGRVRTARGKLVSGARVWVATRAPSGQWRLGRRPLRTSRRGAVSARLPSRAPSRKVRLVYFPDTSSNSDEDSPTRSLRVRSTTTIQSDQGGYRNGDKLTFTGQVARRHLIPSKSVYLQAIVRGRWRTFTTTRADSQGRWRMTHQFEATRRPTRYTFRAVVPGQTGYDWATGTSRKVRVLVTP